MPKHIEKCVNLVYKIVYTGTYAHSFAKVKKNLSFSNEIELCQSTSIILILFFLINKMNDLEEFRKALWDKYNNVSDKELEKMIYLMRWICRWVIQKGRKERMENFVKKQNMKLNKKSL